METVKLLPSVVPTCKLLEVMSKTIKIKDIMISMQSWWQYICKVYGRRGTSLDQGHVLP